MRRYLGLLLFLSVFFIGCLVYIPQGDYGAPSPPAPAPAQDESQWNYDNPDASDYYAYLAPSGLWVSYPSYGYVWVPRGMGYGWRPYSMGQWVWTDCGWTWMGTEAWGWLTYHYGRWGWDASLGWFWVPGTVWGPAWVAWRWGNAYIGWAPLPPGDDFDLRFGYRGRDFLIPGHSWCFVRGIEFMDPRLDRWIVPPERNIAIINYTHIDVNILVRDHRVFNQGVDRDFVRRQTNRVVEPYQLRDARRPSEGRIGAQDVALFRPSLRPNPEARPKEVLSPSQAAARRLTSVARTGGYVGAGPQGEEAAVRQQHLDEMQRLRQDQQAEIRAIQQKAAADRAALRTPEERQRADATAKARIAEAQKGHQAEQAKMAERHKTEEKQARENKGKTNEPPQKH